MSHPSCQGYFTRFTALLMISKVNDKRLANALVCCAILFTTFLILKMFDKLQYKARLHGHAIFSFIKTSSVNITCMELFIKYGHHGCIIGSLTLNVLLSYLNSQSRSTIELQNETVSFLTFCSAIFAQKLLNVALGTTRVERRRSSSYKLERLFYFCDFYFSDLQSLSDSLLTNIFPTSLFYGTHYV